MELTESQKHGLGVALNEATLLGVELDMQRRQVGATFAILALPPDAEPMPADRRVQFIFGPVGRVAACLRQGRWDDPTAPVAPMAPSDLLAVVQSFGGLPIYGWEFFDVAEQELPPFGPRLSFDWRSGPDGTAHSIRLFQDASDRHLDIRVWFDAFVIRNPPGAELSIDEFVNGGRRWWDAFYRRDLRTRGSGLMPLNEEPSN
jgi:hypothetical protein